MIMSDKWYSGYVVDRVSGSEVSAWVGLTPLK
jgi:hypothetical protein